MYLRDMLGWSINLFRVFGIQLAVHASFLLLLAYVGTKGWNDGGWFGMWFNMGLVSLLFVCIVLHELGHSLAARCYGVHVSRILLMPIGGMAEFDCIPQQPCVELWITIAGPAVNCVIVAIGLLFFWSFLFDNEVVVRLGWRNLIRQLVLANGLMGVFNLLPIFPMDGGRIFRALLAMRLPYLQATWWAATIGKVFALTFSGLAAFYFHTYLTAALFLFIFFAGGIEYKTLLRREREAVYWREVALRIKSDQQTTANRAAAAGPRAKLKSFAGLPKGSCIHRSK